MTGSEFSSGHFLQFGAKCPSFWGPQFNWGNFSHKVRKGGGWGCPRRVARSPTRLRRAAMGRPLRLAASRPVCRPQTSPRGGGDGQARRETSPYRASRVAPIAWETDGVEPRGVHVCCQNDRSGPPGQVQPTRRGSSAVGGSGGPEESVCDVPVGPGSTHRWLGGRWDAWFSSSSAGTRTITE